MTSLIEQPKKDKDMLEMHGLYIVNTARITSKNLRVGNERYYKGATLSKLNNNQ